MVIKFNVKILLFLLVLIIQLFSQLSNAQTIDEFNTAYENYYTTLLKTKSPNLDWVIVSHLNAMGDTENELISVKKGIKPRILPQVNSISFASDSTIIYKLPNETVVFENLYSLKNKEFHTIESIINFPSRQTTILKPLDKTELIVVDKNGKIKHHLFNIESNRIDYKTERLYYIQNNSWHVLNLKENTTQTVNNIPKVDWIYNNDTNWFGLKEVGNSLHFFRKEQNSLNVTESIIDPPEHCFFDKSLIQTIEIRENRYILFKLKLDSNKQNLAEISYTNRLNSKSSSYLQLGIYDIVENKWTWKPQLSTPFQLQKFVSEQGEFIVYDMGLNKIDTLVNKKLPIQFVRNYGNKTQSIANKYVSENNFYYDINTDHMLFFEDGKWKSESLQTHQIRIAPFNPEVILADGLYNNLSDRPKAKITPTSEKGIFIVKSEYDLYSWDIFKNKVQLLTNGAADHINYELKAQPLWILGESLWGSSFHRPIDLKKPLLVRGISMKDYTTSLGVITGNKLKIIAQSDFTIKDFEDNKRVVYTTTGFNNPLKIYEIREKKPHLIYESQGKKDGERPILKKELLHYTINGEDLNAFLYYPKNYDAKKKYPMIVRVYEKITFHNREDSTPHLMDLIGFNMIHYILNDYFVLLPDLSYKENDSQETTIKSIEKIINQVSQIPQIESNHIAIVGQSFGGYEAALFMGKTNLFETALIGVPIVDIPRKYLSEFKIYNYNQADYAREERQQTRMNSSLFDNWQGYLEASPIYHVKKVQKPILLWGGADDPNVLSDQVRSFFYGLTRLNKKAIYLNYVNEGHNIIEKAKRQDLNYKAWQWMEHFLKGKPAADWIKPLLEN